MFKNQAGQGIFVFAQNITTGDGVTGDAANITANISKDGGATAATNDVNPTEIGGGVYWFDLTQAETNCDVGVVYAVSGTADVVLAPVFFSTGQDANVTEVLDSAATAVNSSYIATIDVEPGFGGNADSWSISWYKDATPVDPTSVTNGLTVNLYSDGTQLFQATPTEIAALGVYKHTESTNKVVPGLIYAVTVTATIDGSTRTFKNFVKIPKLNRLLRLYLHGSVNTAVAATTTTIFSSDLETISGSLSIDAVIDRWIVFTSGTYAGFARRITDYDGNGGLTFEALPGAPGNGDEFEITGAVKTGS